jgi:hypothetical protein
MMDREIMLESEIAELRSRLARAERLERYIPAAVIDECVAVLDHGDIKHFGEEWKRVLPHIHMIRAHMHIWDFETGGREREEESGCYHLAHAIVRYMMALSQYMGAVQINEEEV